MARFYAAPHAGKPACDRVSCQSRLVQPCRPWHFLTLSASELNKMLGLSLTRRSGALPEQPTTAAPGSDAKVQVMIERASRREALFHPDDATIAQAQPAENSGPDCPHCVLPAPASAESVGPDGSLLDTDPVSDLEWAG